MPSFHARSGESHEILLLRPVGARPRPPERLRARSGYEDLNDHDDLRRDPLLATLVGKTDPTGTKRARPTDAGYPLAGKSTLNRLELTLADAGPDSR